MSSYSISNNIIHSKNKVKNKGMSPNKDYNKKCPICGIKDWSEREGEDGKTIICNLCGFILSQDI